MGFLWAYFLDNGLLLWSWSKRKESHHVLLCATLATA